MNARTWLTFLAGIVVGIGAASFSTLLAADNAKVQVPFAASGRVLIHTDDTFNGGIPLLNPTINQIDGAKFVSGTIEEGIVSDGPGKLSIRLDRVTGYFIKK